jgi:hypothetical protein
MPEIKPNPNCLFRLSLRYFSADESAEREMSAQTEERSNHPKYGADDEDWEQQR